MDHVNVLGVACIEDAGRTELLDRGKVGRLLGGQLGLGKDGEQDGSQNRDDRDDDEELDERKGSMVIIS